MYLMYSIYVFTISLVFLKEKEYIYQTPIQNKLTFDQFYIELSVRKGLYGTYMKVYVMHIRVHCVYSTH